MYYSTIVHCILVFSIIEPLQFSIVLGQYWATYLLFYHSTIELSMFYIGILVFSMNYSIVHSSYYERTIIWRTYHSTIEHTLLYISMYYSTTVHWYISIYIIDILSLYIHIYIYITILSLSIYSIVYQSVSLLYELQCSTITRTIPFIHYAIHYMIYEVSIIQYSIHYMNYSILLH